MKLDLKKIIDYNNLNLIITLYYINNHLSLSFFIFVLINIHQK